MFKHLEYYSQFPIYGTVDWW